MNKGRESETVGSSALSAVISNQENLLFENRIASEQKTSLEKIKWLTTSEAAQYLRVSVSSIKTMIYRGQMRAHKLGRRNRFLADELDRLIVLPNQIRR